MDELCHADRKGVRARLLGSLTLRSCRRFAVDRALSPELYRAVVNHTDCGRILRELLVLDDLVEKLACEFEAILMRYDCAAEWSRWRCEDCQVSRLPLYLLELTLTNTLRWRWPTATGSARPSFRTT